MAPQVPKSSPKKRPLSVEGVAAQVRRLRGNYAAVARYFGVTRRAVAKYVRAHSSLWDVAEDAREAELDEAEDSLGEAVRRGEGWAVCFLLKTRGRSRGYVERLEVREVTDEDIDKAIADELQTLARRNAATKGGDGPV